MSSLSYRVYYISAQVNSLCVSFTDLLWATFLIYAGVLIISLIVTLSRVRIFHFHLRKWMRKSTGLLQLKSDPLGRLAQEPPLLPRSLLGLSYLGFIKAGCVQKCHSLSTQLKFTSIWEEGGVCETAGRARAGFARIARWGFAWSYSLLRPKLT